MTGQDNMRASEDVTFGTTELDRAAHRRCDIDDLAQQPATRAIVMWRGKPLVTDGDAPQLMRLPTDHGVLEARTRPYLLLGFDGETAILAADISPWQAPDVDEGAMSQFFDESVNRHPAIGAAGLFVELRGSMTRLSAQDAAIAATARGVFSWHDSHRHCSRCGAETAMSDGGWRRDCATCGGQHFPRTDPVVIVLATHGNSVLLGRSPHWPEGMYSLLAGFVEPGETIEAASRREVFEESGIQLGAVSYLASQPWPFPTSLMFGTAGVALNTDITLDPKELEDAKWVRREELLEAMAGRDPNLKPARPGSIARFLLDRWLQDDLA